MFFAVTLANDLVAGTTGAAVTGVAAGNPTPNPGGGGAKGFTVFEGYSVKIQCLEQCKKGCARYL